MAHFPELQDFLVSMKAMRKEMMARGEKELHKAFVAFLDRFPEVSELRFQGFVPYFNDGEACVFSIHDVIVSGGDPQAQTIDVHNEYLMENGRPKLDEKGFPIRNPDYDPDGSDDSYYEHDFVGKMSDELKAALSEIDSALTEMEDIVEMVFGSHIRVTVSRNGINVVEYTDHD